jgi:thioesterase domain-containing protein
MAQQLQREGQSVELLVLIDSVAPKLMDRNLSLRSPSDETQENDNGQANVGGPDILAFLDELCRTGTDEQIEEAFAEAGSEGFLPPEITLKDFPGWLQGCRARIEAVRTYAPRPFAGRLVLFKTRAPEHHEVFNAQEEENLGWGELAKGGVLVHTIEGAHQQVVLEPYVSTLAALLKRCLAQSGEGEFQV